MCSIDPLLAYVSKNDSTDLLLLPSSLLWYYCFVLLSLVIPFTTFALFIYFLFFNIAQIINLAMTYSTLRSAAYFPLSCLKILSFFTSKVTAFLTLLCKLMTK